MANVFDSVPVMPAAATAAVTGNVFDAIPTGAAAPASNPAEGMGWLDVYAAAAGKTLTDLGIGARQRIYELLGSQASPFYDPYTGGLAQSFKQRAEALAKEVPAKRALDAPLMNQAGSGWGEFTANTLPFLTLPAKIPGAIAGGLFGFLQPTAPSESVGRNMAVGAGLGQAGQWVGNKIVGPTIGAITRLFSGGAKSGQTLETAIPAMQSGNADALYTAAKTAPGASEPFPAQDFLPKAMEIADEYEGSLSPKVARRIQEFQAGQLANAGEMPAASGAAPREMTIGEAAKFYKSINSTMGASSDPVKQKAGYALKSALMDSADQIPEGASPAWDTFKQATSTYRHDAVLSDLNDALAKGHGKLGALMDSMGDQLSRALSPQELARLSVIRMADDSLKSGHSKLLLPILGGLAGGGLEQIVPHGLGPLVGGLAGTGMEMLAQKLAQGKANAMLNAAQPTIGDMIASVAGRQAGMGMLPLLPNAFRQQPFSGAFGNQ